MRHAPIKFATALCAAGIAYLAAVAPRSDMRSGPAATVSLVPAARADEADVGYAILKCFHPTADFVKAAFGAPFQDAPGRIARNGTIDFRGGFSKAPYQMGFVLQRSVIGGDNMWRVTPTSDNAPFVPDPNCSLRNWTKG